MKRTLISFLTIIFSTHILAGTGSGKITGFIPYSSSGVEIFFVKVATTSTDTPACNTTKRFVIKNTNNPNFKSIQVAAMSAFFSNKNIFIQGNGSCDAFSNSETLTSMCISDIQC